MINTGNDIVSLSAVDIPRTKQPRFYSKIISSSEQALYNEAGISAIPFENYVWLLWSAKEAAFKYLKRIDTELVFSPTKFIVTQLLLPPGFTPANFGLTEKEGNNFSLSTTITGVVAYREEMIYFRSVMYHELVTTVVNSSNHFENTWWGIKNINNADPDEQSAKVREFFYNKLTSLTGIKDIGIKKNLAGIPIVFANEKEADIAVSFSHHGQFVAYSFLLP